MKKSIAVLTMIFVITIVCTGKETKESVPFRSEIEKQSTLRIYDSTGEIRFEYSWKEAVSKYKNADTIYELGWNSNFSDYWFWSATPMSVVYIAKYNVKENHVDYFNPPKFHSGEYCFNADKGLFVYSDYIIPHDAYDREEIKDMEFHLISYNLLNKTEKTIDTQIGKRFNPVFIDSGNTLRYYKNGEERTFSFSK